MQATAKIIILKAKSKRNRQNLCPVRLMVTHHREQKFYSLKEFLPQRFQFLSVETFDVITEKKQVKEIEDKTKVLPPQDRKKAKAFFKQIEEKAEKVIEKLSIFSFNSFEDNFFNKPKTWDKIATAFFDHIAELKEYNRYKYAKSFETTENNLIDYLGESKYKSLKFSDISPKWLTKYSKWLKDNDKSDATTGLYIRNIRVLFNKAIEKGVKAEYPFKQFKIPKGTPNKRALSMEQLKLLFQYEPEQNSIDQFAKDMFMFSFYANGMNLGDVFRLKYNNIQEISGKKFIITERQKTKQRITVPYIRTLQKIVERWGRKAINNDVYILPVLDNEMNETEKIKKIGYKIDNINDHLIKIGKNIGIGHISSVYARHSRATVEKISGKPLSYIQDLLAHSSPAVTQNYLDSLPDEMLTQNAEDLERKLNNNAS
jgi:integrase